VTAAHAQILASATLAGLVPLAVIALILAALAKWAAPLWALILAVLLGIALTGTILGPHITPFLSQLSGGYLH
jgi:hypothetical protein